MKRIRRLIVRWLMPELNRQMYKEMHRAGREHVIEFTPGPGGKLTAESRTIGPNEVV